MTSNLPIAARRADELGRSEVIATFFAGLSDPTRVRILELLAAESLTVSELVDRLGLAQGRVSSHLSCLRWCGYVEARVEGRYNRYRLVDERVREISGWAKRSCATTQIASRRVSSSGPKRPAKG